MQVEGHEIIIGGATIQDSAGVLGLELDPAIHPDTSFFMPIWAPWPDGQTEGPESAPSLPIEDYTLGYGTGMYYEAITPGATSDDVEATGRDHDSNDPSNDDAAYGYNVSYANASGLQRAEQGAITIVYTGHRIGHDASLANEADAESEADSGVNDAEQSESEATGHTNNIATPAELSSAAPLYMLPSTIDNASTNQSLDDSEHDTPRTVGEVISSRRIERSEWITWQPRMTRSMTNAVASSSAQASMSAAGPSTAPQGQKRKSLDTDDDEDLPGQHGFRDEESAYEEEDEENEGEGGDAIEEAEEDSGFDVEERHLRDTATAGPDGRRECPAPNCGKLLSSLEIMVRHWKGCKKRPDPQSIPCPGCGKLFARGDAMRRHHRNPNACEGYVADDEARPRPKRGRGSNGGRGSKGGGGGRKRARRG
ncbi:predicted protein [Postia placenta Mad-698-R]|uniref:C2H2-type domain-containing protein n=1 Tax=Postia placenta MAD-698-R-SB12 TaxID=670580 RepID=A0A1X6MX76_9APHY|nr:hypothetical protein POSPLADRAFT_1146070 [Postia placenta MAD-698-R-SB12]EED85702.1 predicted protein [Postia placenta Mad-698-R]OSX60975.1 hypothetical protein POSPLADRAFT_1146070 [Postia placenta MAD-698-R-SB12]